MLLLALLLSVSARADAVLPSKVLYHVGQKDYLLDEGQNGISEEVWRTNIMGRSGRYGLVPWRRGLYGGADFYELELYGNDYLGSRDGK